MHKCTLLVRMVAKLVDSFLHLKKVLVWFGVDMNGVIHC